MTFVQIGVFLNVLLVVRTTKWTEDCPKKCKCSYSRRADWKKTVDCSRTQLTSVPRFENPVNVTYLILKDNLIHAITGSDFNGFSSLVRLDISGNPLKQIPKLVLNIIPKLAWLKLQIETLEADSFVGLKSLESLYIYGSKAIRSIDRAMLEPVRLTLVHLEVHSTSVEHFPDMADFKSLEKLDLHGNQLKTFIVNESLRLKSVDLSNNNLKTLSLSNMTLLHNLNASHNQLETITLNNCREIWVLDLGYNRLVELHEGMLEPMEHLHTLLLANNLLEKINISNCSPMRTIDLDFNHRLANLNLGPQTWLKSPCHIYSMSIVRSNLTKLHVPYNIVIQNLNISFNCQLVDFHMRQHDYYKEYSVDWSSSCMSYLHRDDVLGKYFRNRVDLHNNSLIKIYTVEDSVKYIDLSMNQLNSIEFNVMGDTGYGTVDLSYNNPVPALKTYWYDMQSSTVWNDNYMRFVKISFQHSNLISFPNLTRETGDTRVVIEELDFSYNSLTTLNESLSKLIKEPENLKILNLSYNNLRYIKTSVFDSSLFGLKKLDLSHNQLSDSFTVRNGLRKLQNLDLSYNSIEKIFTNRSQYHQNLVTLNLRNNQLTKAPFIDFVKWKRLTNLDLRMNSITEIPMEMLQQIDSFYGGPKHHKLSLDLLLSNVTYGEPTRRIEILLSGNPLRCDCTLVLALAMGLLKPNDTCYSAINDGNSSSMLCASSLRKLITRSGNVPCNFCQFNVCHNRGNCFSDKESGFKCKCHNGYEGDRCDEIDCLKSGHCHRCYGNHDYCQNGGECIQYPGNSQRKKCRCPDHYTGEVCQHHVTKPCKTQQQRQQTRPCQNGGICQVEPLGNISCVCTGDFEGEFCELEKLSSCDRAFCNQHGVCVLNEANRNRECICDKEWGGRKCNVNAPHPQKSTGRIRLSNIGNIVLGIMLILAIVALVFVIRRYKSNKSKEEIVHYRLHENLDD